MEILGIDVGGTGIKAAIVNSESGALMTERVRVDTPQPPTVDAIKDVLVKLSNQLETNYPKIGVAFPARVKNGIVTTATNIDPAFVGTNLNALLSSALGKQVSVMNDADAAGVAEMAFGAGQGRMGLVITITVGTGLGSSIFINGALVPGTELGHLKLKGKIAEDYASDKSRKDKDLTWEEWAGRFQKYLDRVEFLFAPDLIIIGGGVSKSTKKPDYFHFLSTKADLVTATLGNNAGIVGAAQSVAA